ncbi:hypothetical protein Psi02_75220 [Planotetraspora silvatica]|uniref:NlpC/P60 domain-containing protein n=1 Tax=Planotetraspora silvatica TaxID=234614 RepID=A0A8J3UTP4_9ACTN|nr:NlpC/P60 family protein [Planotetraspora silvatica]GII51098.1 hypothetical protein Psi02_75220 [Planotetraspora silvatica]
MKPGPSRLRKLCAPLVGAAAMFVALFVAPGAAEAAVGSHSYTVTATLDGRTAKDLNNHAYPNKYPNGSTITVVCQDSGPDAYGSTVWDRTSDNLWVTDFYVKTGHSGFTDEVPRCVNGGAPGSGSGRPYTVSATLDGRTERDVNNHAYVDKYPSGSVVWITCQTTGPDAYGSNLWDYTDDNLWVPDFYVKTGYSGPTPQLPRCSGDETDPPGTGPHSFPVTATLDGRTVKDVDNHAYPNRYFDGQYVEITCQDSGPSAYGSTIWDLTYEGLWIPDFYVSTGSTGFSSKLPRCTSGGGGSTGGHSYVVTATLDGRTAKSLSNHAYPDKYPSGSTVTITCQAYGEFTYGGSAIWDKTTDGLWVVDYYVKTGTDGFVAGLPRCDNTPPPAGGDPSGWDPGSPAPPSSTHQEKVNAAIAAARAEITNHPLYAWGGGHGAHPGPTRGFCDGINGYDTPGHCAASLRIGFDCSGLMRWAFYQGTSVDIGPVTTYDLYNHRPSIFAYTIHRVSDLQPGDLILSRPDSSGRPAHTVIVSKVSGSSITIIEAPRTTIPLRETAFPTDTFVVGYRLA